MAAFLESPVPIPGSFAPEHENIFDRPSNRSSIFLPPTDDSPYSATPTSKSFLPQPVSNPTDHENRRKRPRLSSVRTYNHTSHNDSYTSIQPPSRDALSPPPFVNTNYRMAGGLDTQTLSTDQQEEDAREYDFEVDCRPNRFAQQPSESIDSYFPNTACEDTPTNARFSSTPSENNATNSYFPYTPGVDQLGGSKRKQLSSSPKGWSKTVWALTGGIAGKVINFCWNTTFKGFYAGGGNGYQFDIGTPDVKSKNIWTEVDTRQDVFHTDYNVPPARQEREHTPVPGGFPDEQPDFIEDYMSNPSQAQMHDRAPPSLSARNDWVVVDRPEEDSSRETSPIRKKSRASTANLYARPTPTRHVSAAARPRLPSRSSTYKSSASFASPRTSSLTTHSLSASLRSRQSHAGSNGSGNMTNLQIPAHVHTPPPSAKRLNTSKSRASLASPRRHASQPADLSASQKPSPEVRKFEQKLRRKEAKQDETMNRFNAQLQAMIREGQQALGSRVEVESDGVDVDVDLDEDEDVDQGYYAYVHAKSNGNAKGSERRERERDYVRPGVWA